MWVSSCPSEGEEQSETLHETEQIVRRLFGHLWPSVFMALLLSWHSNTMGWGWRCVCVCVCRGTELTHYESLQCFFFYNLAYVGTVCLLCRFTRYSRWGWGLQMVWKKKFKYRVLTKHMLLLWFLLCSFNLGGDCKSVCWICSKLKEWQSGWIFTVNSSVNAVSTSSQTWSFPGSWMVRNESF